MKRFNQVSQKLSAAVAVGVFAASAFALSACGGGESKAEAFVKDFVKKKQPDAKILTFSEIQKEFGLKDKECLVEKGDTRSVSYHFVKSASGEVTILKVSSSDSGSGIRDTFAIDDFKARNSKCF